MKPRTYARVVGTLTGVGLAALLGCKGPARIHANDPAPPAPPAAAAAPAGAAAAPKLYGAPLTAAAPVTIAALLAKPDAFAAAPVTVEGQVRKACTRKGCWMELAESTAAGTQGARVTFKDYGFFVPLDSAGAKARVQGKVEVDTLSAAAVRHYEEEGAHFAAKKPDGTAPEVRLVASGVELWR